MTTYEEAMRMQSPRPQLQQQQQERRRPGRTIVLESAEEVEVETVEVKGEDAFEEEGNEEPVVPAPQYVTVRTHDKRDGSVREYAVLKGTPVSRVLHQYARDIGVDETSLRARIKDAQRENDFPVDKSPPSPIHNTDCAEIACSSWQDVMCGIADFDQSRS